eukprot:558035-Pyramimonas_sp.AAC.1
MSLQLRAPCRTCDQSRTKTRSGSDAEDRAEPRAIHRAQREAVTSPKHTSGSAQDAGKQKALLLPNPPRKRNQLGNARQRGSGSLTI